MEQAIGQALVSGWMVVAPGLVLIWVVGMLAKGADRRRRAKSIRYSQALAKQRLGHAAPHVG
jgi:hypothetical protein